MSDQVIAEAKQKMENAVKYLHEEYGKLHTGRASAALVEGLEVEVFGSVMPLKGLASISIPESNQIAIQPWNRDHLPNIEKAILEAKLGLNPSNNGQVIRLIIPPLTEDRRRDLVKLVHKYAEDARVSIRNSRHDALKKYESMEKGKEISEDELVGKEKSLQKEVEDFNARVEADAKQKEKDIMTV
ncbi:ribosome recycling factor [Patescibacteria group bacterium]|nr:ribosome recycling factor [Patescibacteria group bacterium]MBU1016354.1 ribosome recycling factor [Patescibacteria group bacterium]MBU1684648.1 ribosome recycling factor [Patescibacteria group bacterium]MBU1938424.1 ribosome recycling factor [Patescibacteria group bacterium]